MKLTMQDGRELTVNPDNRIGLVAPILFMDGEELYSTVKITEAVLNERGKVVAINFRKDLGIYENHHAWELCDTVRLYVESNVDYAMPQPTILEAAAIAIYENMEAAIKKYRLTVATPEETAIGLKGWEYRQAVKLAEETDYWEQGNTLIERTGISLLASFRKWLSYHPKAAAELA